MRPIDRMLTGQVAAVLTVLVSVMPAGAQTLGTFRWQLQPFCNVVTVTVTQSGAVYTLDGYDDQCGAPQRAPLVGLATPNPDGSIGLGLNIVTVPGGRAVSVDARISLATLGGNWTDSAGNIGTAVFNGAAAGRHETGHVEPLYSPRYTFVDYVRQLDRIQPMHCETHMNPQPRRDATLDGTGRNLKEARFPAGDIMRDV